MEADFLEAVDEASQAGPLPQPPAVRKADPTRLVGSPAPRRRTLISPTRPLPKVAAPIEGKQGPVPGSRADRTTTGEPSMLVRATASAVPTRGARIDSGAEGAATRGGTRASMPAPVVVHAPTEGSRPIRILSDDSKQIKITDAESRPIPIGKDDSKQIRLGTGAPTPIARDDSRQVRLGGTPTRIGRDDSRPVKLGGTPTRIGRDDSRPVKLGGTPTRIGRDDSQPVKLGGTPTKIGRDDSQPVKLGGTPTRIGRDDSKPFRMDDAGKPTAIEDDDSVPTAVGRAAAKLPPVPPRTTPTRSDASDTVAKPQPPRAEGRDVPVRSGATVPDGSVAPKFEPPKPRTQPPMGGQVQMIDAAVAAALVDAQAASARAEERVVAVPGRLPRDPAAKGHTQPAPIVPLERPAAQARAPKPTPIERTPAPAAAPPHVAAAEALRKAWRRVPNWTVAAAFALVGLTAGIVIAAGSDDDEVVRADVLSSRVASTTPEPAPSKPTPPPAPSTPEPVEPAPTVEEPTTPEVVAILEDTPQVLEDPSPSLDASSTAPNETTPRRRGRRRPRAEEPLQAPAPDPEPEPKPEPPPPRPKPSPPSASALLQQARSALGAGDYATAYRLAQRSHRTSASNDALSMMAKAACRRNDKDAALSALRQLPLLDRAPVRRDCRKAGSRIGL